MSDRERLKAMISPRRDKGSSWFVAHFRNHPNNWHPVFIDFMDLRHRLNAQPYPTKFFEFCLLDDFDFDAPDWVEKWKRAYNADEVDMGIKICGDEGDCPPITDGQFLGDAGPIAEANRAAWRKFIERHCLDNEDLQSAADEMQPAIDYYITHNDYFGGGSAWGNRWRELENPTPLPAWLVGIVDKEPQESGYIYWREWEKRGRPRGPIGGAHAVKPK